MRLTDDLKAKYRQSIDEYERESQRLNAWYAGLKGDVYKYCDERSNELHETGSAIVVRLDTLEQFDRPAELRRRAHVCHGEDVARARAACQVS